MSNSQKLTWEKAVDTLRGNPSSQQAVYDNYFDRDLIVSCERFHSSEEFGATLKLLRDYGQKTGHLLDIGAGRGIASYAFAKEGYQVTALEPDPSSDVGYEAIKEIALKAQVNIKVCIEVGERLPFADNVYDVVYARQVLHHAYDLPQFLKEASRVLKQGGILVATREHVIDSLEDKEAFLKNHALHYLYGGENAFLLKQYINAIEASKLKLLKVVQPYDSVINFFPTSIAEQKEKNRKLLKRFCGPLSNTLSRSNKVQEAINRVRSLMDRTPGRLFSFVAVKP